MNEAGAARAASGASLEHVVALAEFELEMRRHYSSGEEGWHFFWLRNTNDKQSTRLSVSSDEPFVDARFLRGDRLEFLNFNHDTKYITRTDRSFTIDLGRRIDEKIHLKTPSPLTTLQLSITGNDPIQVALGDSPPRILTEWQAMLKPADALTDTPGEFPDTPSDLPLLVIQYSKPKELALDKSILSEEDIEELKALGYLE